MRTEVIGLESNVLLPTDRPWRAHWGMTLLLFLGVLSAEIAGAYILLYRNGYILSDAIARTANAYYVLYISPPKLASIGLVWNPLPSFMQLPFLLFARLWPPLATYGVAGGLVTAIFAAINVAYLFRCFKHYGTSTWLSLLFLLLLCLNPFWFYYGCNGMSEMPFYTSIIVSTHALGKWNESRKTFDLVVIAVILCLGFLCRYEALAIAAGVGIAVLAVIYFAKDPHSAFQRKSLRMRTEYSAATYVLVFLPFVFTVGVWILLNWTIMGDPLHFLNSQYSNSAQSEYIRNQDVILAMSNPASTFVFMMQKMLPFLPLAIAMGVERIASKRLFRIDFFLPFSLFLLVSGFHFSMLTTHKSFGWLRFYSFALPIYFAWLPYELSRLKGLLRQASVLMFATALILSGLLVYGTFDSQIQAPEEYEAIYQTDVSGVALQRQAAERINTTYLEDTILLDSFTMSTLVLHLHSPERLIINTSEVFQAAVRAPSKFDVRYIIVADPNGIGALDTFNIVYPDLYSGGEEWCVEREEIHGFKVFEVLY